MSIEDPFLRAAFDEAQAGLAEGGIPIGSVLVADYKARTSDAPATGQIVAAGHNLRVQSDDPTAHAEMVCIRNAGRRRDWHALTIYTTLSPCAMCSGTVILFNIPNIMIGEHTTFMGDEQHLQQMGKSIHVFHDATCVEMMQSFIANSPDLWNEDIGLP